MFLRSLNVSLPRATCHSRRNVVIEAICLQVASNLLASRSPHYVRDDNPELVTREPCKGEVIYLLAKLILSLLRYARNDKSQDSHEAQSLSP